jgi:hypothetical protein
LSTSRLENARLREELETASMKFETKKLELAGAGLSLQSMERRALSAEAPLAASQSEVERLRTRLAAEETIAAENARLMTLWQGREAKAAAEVERLRGELASSSIMYTLAMGARDDAEAALAASQSEVERLKQADERNDETIERLRTRLAAEETIAAENARLMTLWQGREAAANRRAEELEAARTALSPAPGEGE